MKEPIENLLNSLDNICEYYVRHNQPADAADIQNAIDAYCKEIAEIANVDMCNLCKYYKNDPDVYPCNKCLYCYDDYYEYRDNWDENGKYIPIPKPTKGVIYTYHCESCVYGPCTKETSRKIGLEHCFYGCRRATITQIE